jgi:hypothetical protein
MKLTPSIFLFCSLLLSIESQPIEAIEHPAIPDNRLAVAKDEFSLLHNERIGNLRIGLAEAKVKQTINCQLNREPEQFWGADGAYHQKWKYADCGITLGMVSEQKGAAKSIESITIFHPSRLITKRGIRIGSSKKAVINAYKSDWNSESSKSANFVAGSIYGGLIFQFQHGKVSQIFLGAAAE